MGQIDTLVEAISTGRDLLELAAGWDSLLSASRPLLTGADSTAVNAFLRSERELWSERGLPVPISLPLPLPGGKV